MSDNGTGLKPVPLFARLPAIYRIRDGELNNPGQLENYLGLVEEVFEHLRQNVEELYNDLFIETCDPWAIPYIGDLVGTSHLIGDPWTLRADVADTIALRRRKGTLGAIELLASDLTEWRVHAVELRDRMLWNQQLNHLRPDVDSQHGFLNKLGGVRGGIASIRDPATASQAGTPYDPFAHIADLKPVGGPASNNEPRYNLPNLAVFIWTLRDYRVPCAQPAPDSTIVTPVSGSNPVPVGFHVHPLKRALRLFNAYKSPGGIDSMPAPIPPQRITEGFPSSPENDSYVGNYVAINTYDDSASTPNPQNLAAPGLQLHFPRSKFGSSAMNFSDWTIRAADLSAWKPCPDLVEHEIAIDPVLGRFIVGAATADEANALLDGLLVTYTYGAPGPVGAQPISRQLPPLEWVTPAANWPSFPGASGTTDPLQAALTNAAAATEPTVIEINDSKTYTIDLGSQQLKSSLWIRAADSQRPTILLKRALGFTTAPSGTADPLEITVRLEGLFILRHPDYSATHAPLIDTAMVSNLEIVDCTLDPGGTRLPDGTRLPSLVSLSLADPGAANEVPQLLLKRTIAGPLAVDMGYKVTLQDCIIDAGKPIGDTGSDLFAIGAATLPATDWGADFVISGTTVFGRTRVQSLSGSGAIWLCKLEVNDNQRGCICRSYIYDSPVDSSRYPPNSDCVFNTAVTPLFDSVAFEEPAYARLQLTNDPMLLQHGPAESKITSFDGVFSDDADPVYAVIARDGAGYRLGDAMGAYGFQLNSYRWSNLATRLREFMPAGMRAIIIPVNYCSNPRGTL